MKLRPDLSQDKAKEMEFFDHYASGAEYNVFSDESNGRILDHCIGLAGWTTPNQLVDLGCGAGVFSAGLAQRGFDVTGLDLSHAMVRLARKNHPRSQFVQGDVENLPFQTGRLNGVLLSGIIHHLPDPAVCLHEVYRVLKPGASFAAFDPNRLNPFMYLYRDRSSPFYSQTGVTSNERPVMPGKLRELCESAGFLVKMDYLSVEYRYVASTYMRRLLPLYNKLDALLFAPGFVRSFRAFVLVTGQKPLQDRRA